MENREFISAKDLPIAEGDDVSVLCVENGEMKQKPAKGLGVKSIVLKTRSIDYNGEKDNECSVEPLPVGTFASIKSAILGGEFVQVFNIHTNHFISSEHNEEETYVNCYTGINISYVCASNNYPEAMSFEAEIPCVLLPDDRIMTMDEFEQEMGGGE